jgi:hypothetical protein
MRIVTLTLNALRLTRPIELKGCHFFDLIREDTPIIRANNREYIIPEDDIPILISKETLAIGTYQ